MKYLPANPGLASNLLGSLIEDLFIGGWFFLFVDFVRALHQSRMKVGDTKTAKLYDHPTWKSRKTGLANHMRGKSRTIFRLVKPMTKPDRTHMFGQRDFFQEDGYWGSLKWGILCSLFGWELGVPPFSETSINGKALSESSGSDQLKRQKNGSVNYETYYHRPSKKL